MITDVNSLSPDQISKLKEQYGKLFKTTLCGTTYLSRLLYKPDWDSVAQVRADNPKAGLSDLNNLMDEKIVGLCLLGPFPSIETGGWSTQPAGVLSSLSMIIRAKSGFIVPDAEDVALPLVEDLDPDIEPVKPPAEELAAIKSVSRFPLKGIAFGSDYYVVRPIARVEFKEIMSSPAEDQDLKLAQKAVIWPKGVNWDSKGAGYCDTISQLVMAISGFSGPTAVEDL